VAQFFSIHPTHPQARLRVRRMDGEELRHG